MTGPLDHVQLTLVDSVEKAMEFKRWLGERRKKLGVDTETGGFDHIRDKLRLVQFGDLNAGWAIPWERWGGVAVEALNQYDAPMVLHNLPFDAKFIIHNAPDLKRWKWEWMNDTMTQAHLLDPLRPKGLKPLGAMHVDRKAASAQRMLDEAMVDNKWTWATVPVDFPYYWIYGAMDPVLTCHLDEKFSPEVQDSYKDVYDLEMNTLRVVTGMMLKGARVDLDYCHQKQEELMTWVAQSRTYLAEVWGIGNATSNPQVIAALERNGIELPRKFTKAGAQSLDKEVLETIAYQTNNHPIVQQVLAIRKAEKNVGPYFKNFIRLADDQDRVHATIWSMGTRTARMSITDPGLQTLPRKDPIVRTAFIPSEGHTIITSDYDQIEARLCAHFSQDVGMLEAFASDTDFFFGLASRIYGKDIANILKEERQLTKNTTYGKIYGAGVEKMAETAGVPYDQMYEVVSAFDRQFPGVKQLQIRVNTTAHERYKSEGVAYIKTPMGRKLIADDNKEYTLTNYLIQSHAAEILKRKLVELDAVGMGDYMILPVHDEVVFDVPNEETEEAAVLIGETMCDMENYYVPITASPEIIDGAWGSKYA